jgi:hypothetical protein
MAQGMPGVLAPSAEASSARGTHRPNLLNELAKFDFSEKDFAASKVCLALGVIVEGAASVDPGKDPRAHILRCGRSGPRPLGRVGHNRPR